MALAFMDPDPAPAPGLASEAAPSRPGVDWVGILLLTFALGSLQVVLEQGEQVDWFSDQRLRSLALLAAVALPVFVWWAAATPGP